MNKNDILNSLMELFKDKNVDTLIVNNEIVVNKKKALMAIAESCEETAQAGDIKGTVLNFQNLQKFNKANELAYNLFENIKEIEVECYSNLSFGTTRITTDYFRFDIENVKKNNKELFQQFIDTIDFLDISSGINRNEIEINFAVSNVWSE